MSDKPRDLPTGYKIASPAALVAMLSFFMPWVLVSCGNQPLASFSGWDLTVGTTVTTFRGESPVDGSPILFIALLAGLGVFVLMFFSMKTGKITKLDGWGLVSLGVISLLTIIVVILSRFQEVSESSQGAARVEYQYGFWGVVLGYAAVILGGVINIMSERDVKSAIKNEHLG